MNRMNKIVSDFIVSKNIRISDTYSRLVLTEIRLDGVNSIDYNEIKPGQFVEVRVDGNKTTFLRRPISINYVVPERREIHLLVRKAGDGTKALCDCSEGDVINMMLPLGNGFSLPTDASNEKDTHLPYRPLLIGGGVGVAPLLHLGKILNSSGIRPTFLLAARSCYKESDSKRRLGYVLLLWADAYDEGCSTHCNGQWSTLRGLIRELYGMRIGSLPMLCGGHD